MHKERLADSEARGGPACDPSSGVASDGARASLRRPWQSALAVPASLALMLAGCGRSNEYFEPPPPEVIVCKPLRREVTEFIGYTGTAQASEQVEVRARVRGFLKEITFKDGDFVDAGRLLFVIDEEPFRVRLEQAAARREEAEAALARSENSKVREIAQAQLELNQSQQSLAQIEVQRARALMTRNAGTREEQDRAEAALGRWDAQVNADRATLEQAKADFDLNILAAKSSLAAARAEVRNAEIDLGYCRVSAPIAGRINARRFDVGNYVGDGQSDVLSTIVRVDPIYAYIAPSESDLIRVRTLVSKRGVPNVREAGVVMEMGLAEDEGYPYAGVVDFIDPTIDAGTGTGRLRATFPNADGVVAPGAFIRVRIPYEHRADALLVPERAVGSDQGGAFVLVVGEGGQVERRAVRTGSDLGADRVIESGVGPDDRVVVEGLLRARPGIKVSPKDRPSGEGAPAGGSAATLTSEADGS